jgi:hypothetical protein
LDRRGGSNLDRRRQVTVDTARRDGPRLTSAAGGSNHGEHTDVYANPLSRADAVVQQVIRDNL